MPIRAELTVPAVRAAVQAQAPEPVSRQILRSLGNPDLQVVIIFALVGLFASVMLASLFPLSADTAAILAQLS